MVVGAADYAQAKGPDTRSGDGELDDQTDLTGGHTEERTVDGTVMSVTT